MNKANHAVSSKGQRRVVLADAFKAGDFWDQGRSDMTADQVMLRPGKDGKLRTTVKGGKPNWTVKSCLTRRV
jgi:hypothetical protein